MNVSTRRAAVIAAVALAVVAVGGGLAWYVAGDRIAALVAGGGDGGDGSGQGQRPPTPVEAANAEQGTVEVTVEAVGTVTAPERVELTADAQGVVEAIYFDEGEQVEPGQLLLELDAEEERALVGEAEARLENARRQLARIRELAAEDFATESRLDELRAERASAEARLRTARAGLAERRVTAPFGGRVGLRRVSPGDLVTPGTTITTLAQLQPIELEFDVPSDLLARLRAGMAVVATAPAFEGREFRGEVAVVEPEVDPETRSVTLVSRLPNEDRALKPGLFMDVELVLETRRSVLVPERALLLRGDDSFVFVVGEDNTVARTAVRTGEWQGGEVEVTSGLEPGQRIVVAGLQKIQDGQTVEPVDPGPARQDGGGGSAAAATPADGGGGGGAGNGGRSGGGGS